MHTALDAARDDPDSETRLENAGRPAEPNAPGLILFFSSYRMHLFCPFFSCKGSRIDIFVNLTCPELRHTEATHRVLSSGIKVPLPVALVLQSWYSLTGKGEGRAQTSS